MTENQMIVPPKCSVRAIDSLEDTFQVTSATDELVALLQCAIRIKQKQFGNEAISQDIAENAIENLQCLAKALNKLITIEEQRRKEAT
ncbi:MAG: hypothetical protein M2R45_00907 [Verrucomicrobia subdivision 3 bacterium]|nr:hypothetical protein [Limisphaerales bacterium]MCS1414576.1 hypothetical protein [Limisphaerales bacterium]